MKCENCGEEIREGFDYCENCGAPIGDTVVLGKESLKKVKEYNKNAKLSAQKKIKKVKKEEKKEEAVPFYEKKSAMLVSSITGLLAGVLMTVSPFLTWIRVRGSDIGGTLYVNRNLFQITSRPAFLLIIYALLIICTGLMMLYITLRGNFNNIKLPYIGIFENGSYRKLIPSVVGIILLFLITNHDSFETRYEQYKETQAIIENNKIQYEMLGYQTAANMYCDVGYGMGFYAVILAVVLFLFSLAFKFIIDTLNEED